MKAAVDWSENEISAWQLPREMTVSEWADECRILDSKTSAEPGPWQTDRTPFLREIQDAFADPFVEQISFLKCTQIGGTECAYNMLGYLVDQDPGPALVVYPTEPIARSVSQNRVQPMFRLSPALRKHLPALEDDFKTLEYKLDRMLVNFAWAGSPAALASMAKRVVIGDEIDKWPKFSGREADPVKLMVERTRTFWNRKIVLASTPTTAQGYIWREFQKSDRCQFFIPCPHCGRFQALTFGRIQWPEGERDPATIAGRRLAWYECESCNGRIEDRHKPQSLSGGKWVPEGGSIDKRGRVKRPAGEPARHRGFWLNCCYSPWLTFSDVAAEFLKSKDYPELLQNFVNSWLAEIWEEKVEENDPEKLARLATATGAGIVPAGAQVLTAGIDVQKGHFYFAIRAWGFFEESWLVLAQRVESWEALTDVIFRTDYPGEDGKKTFPVRLACIDSGYRTAEVYEVARRFSDVCRAVKGQDRLTGVPYRASLVERHPVTGEPIAGGLRLWHIDVSYMKDKIARLVASEPGTPGNWHLHAEPAAEYLKQFCAEKKIIDRNRRTGRAVERWAPVSIGAPNHYLDAEVYATAAAQMLQVHAMRKDGDGRQVHRPEPQRQRENWVRGRGRRRGNWFGRK
jgi:phage terminase large subunit GpA-like protein